MRRLSPWLLGLWLLLFFGGAVRWTHDRHAHHSGSHAGETVAHAAARHEQGVTDHAGADHAPGRGHDHARGDGHDHDDTDIAGGAERSSGLPSEQAPARAPHPDPDPGPDRSSHDCPTCLYLLHFQATLPPTVASIPGPALCRLTPARPAPRPVATLVTGLPPGRGPPTVGSA